MPISQRCPPPSVIASERHIAERSNRLNASRCACGKAASSGLLHQRQLCCRGFAMTEGRLLNSTRPLSVIASEEKQSSGKVASSGLLHPAGSQ
ncbi:MAG: hypothetical protein LBT00_01045 [Spirochaetaceae bacterium]|nr:hypothetical protein [Spirochaetaceae bacterium]